MSSVMRYTREPTFLSKRFTVFPYYGAPPTSSEYYFTVSGEKLYRIEADFIGTQQWVVARDMGTQTRITSIDPEIIEYWENNNGWSNITILRNGTARKFQALAIPKGDIGAGYNSGPGWNSSAYTDPNDNMTGNIYNPTNTGINDMLVMGNPVTTIDTAYEQNLPFGTFYAVVDPVVLQYEQGGNTYTRAVVNRVTPS